MSTLHRYRARREEGFSLIELLIVTGIVSTLSALAMPAYFGALEKARVTRAIGDVNAIGKEIVMFNVTRNCFPVSLKDIQRDNLRDPWGRPYVYVIARAPGGGGKGGGGSCQACGDVCEAPGKAMKDKHLKPVNADFDLLSLGKDGETAANLSNKKTNDDIIRGRSGSYIGLASEF